MEETELGPYRILRELGRGGMGTVFLAEVTRKTPRLEAGDRVALKVVHAHLLEAEGFFKRFLREAQIGQQVRDPNVVRCHDCDVLRSGGEQVTFMVTEYVEGRTLRELLRELGQVPEELCRHIGREIAKGLVAIHAAGVVHRDVKPENVLITPDHAVKVMDLGVARLKDEQLRLSQTGAFTGSVQYAAPEQFSPKETIDGRTDLHALGVTLYELATGQNPFVAEDIPQTLRRVLYDEPRRCAEINPQLSPFFEELVHSLMAKKRDERFRSAAELVRVLDEAEDSAWWKARAKTIRAETRRPLRRIRIPRETALYGREAEIAHLRTLFGRAKEGTGQFLLIEGEAGVGKSRLVDELVGLLQREGEDLNFLYGSYPPGGAATASGAFATAFREQFGAESVEDTLAPYLKETPTLVPAFAALLRGEGVPQGAEGLTKDSLQTVFIESMRGLAAERPTILWIDDLHFAPQEGRSLLAALGLAVPGHRLLLVGSTRPGLEEKWLAELDRIGVARMAVPRLGAKDLVRLLADALRSEQLAEELAYRIASKTDGNPLFVFEILRGLREGQFLAQKADGSWVTTHAIAEIRIPSTILEMIQARVSDLDDTERNLLDVAACVGFEFDPLLVAQVLELPKIPAIQTLAKMEKRHRLVRSSGRRFVFDQHQVQEACYAGLPDILREEYHASIAERLEQRFAALDEGARASEGALSVELSEHFLRANRGERALPYLDGALTHLERGFLHETALRLEDRLLAVPGLLSGQRRWQVLLRHARRLDLLGHPTEEMAVLQEVGAIAESEGRSALRAKARNELGDLLRRLGRNDESQQALDDALALSREAEDREGEAVATLNLGVLAWARGRYDEARPHLEGGLALARAIANRRLEATARLNLATLLHSLGRHEEARAHYEETLALKRAVADHEGEVRAAANLGLVCGALGRYAEAIAHVEEALRLSRQIGYRPGEAHATACLGDLLRALGRYEEARAHLERYGALSREFGNRTGEAQAKLYLGLVAWELGPRSEAHAHMTEALAAFRKLGWRWGEVHALAAIGTSLAQEERVAEARAHLAEAAALAHGAALPGIEYVARAWLAVLPGDDPAADRAAALQAVHDCEGGSGLADAMLARFLLWRGTHDAGHLEEAKRRLDRIVEQAPADWRTPMVERVPLYRDIAAASARAAV